MSTAPTTIASGSTTDRPPVHTPEPPEHKRSGWVRPVVYTLIVSCIGFAVWRIATAGKKADQQKESRQQFLANRPVPVQVAQVSQRTMPIYLTALGTVTPYNTVQLKAQVSGQLMKVNFIEGQEVRAGQNLIQIDSRPYKATLDQARGALAHDQALLKNAQADYERYKALYQEGVVSKQQLDLQESTFGQYLGQIESDQAAVVNDELQLKWCYVNSPISGRIGLRLVDPGNLITANTTPLLVINQFQPIAVYFTLPEDQLPQVLSRLGKQRKLVVEAYDRSDTIKIAEGELLTADNQIDTTTGTGKLKAVFSNNDEHLFPNQFVNIHLILEQKQGALVVPSAAVQTGTQGTYVWMAGKDGTSTMRPVSLQLAEGQVSILESGVAPGEEIVVDGMDKLRDGGKIEIHHAADKKNRKVSGEAGGTLSGTSMNNQEKAKGGKDTRTVQGLPDDQVATPAAPVATQTTPSTVRGQGRGARIQDTTPQNSGSPSSGRR